MVLWMFSTCCFSVFLSSRNELCVWKIGNQIFQRINVRPVLLYGISELIFFFVDDLHPVFGVFISENPAFIIFRLNHENSVNRNDNMVNLNCSAIFSLENNIVQDFVVIMIQ